MNPLIALDFDGVICDSVDECLITAHNAYHQIQGRPQWIDSLAALDPGLIDRFRKLRHMAANAADFWLVYDLAAATGNAVAPTSFKALRKEHRVRMNSFEPLFFQARLKLRSAGLTEWLALHRPYPEFQEGWDQLRAHFPVYLVTTKDRASIDQFNRHWQLGFGEQHLWTKERGLNKAHAVAAIAQQTGRKPEDILFVDDHPEHLAAVSTTGARCYWAAWGYLGVYGPAPAEDSPFTPIAKLSDLLAHLPIID